MTIYREKEKQMTYQEMMLHLEKCKDEQFKFIHDFSTKIRLYLSKFSKETAFNNLYFIDHHYSENENDKWFKFNFNEKYCLLRINFKIKLNNVEIDVLKQMKFHWNKNEELINTMIELSNNDFIVISNSSDLLQIISNEAENKIKQLIFGDFKDKQK